MNCDSQGETPRRHRGEPPQIDKPHLFAEQQNDPDEPHLPLQMKHLQLSNGIKTLQSIMHVFQPFASSTQTLSPLPGSPPFVTEIQIICLPKAMNNNPVIHQCLASQGL
jgi:hypothetical protein